MKARSSLKRRQRFAVGTFAAQRTAGTGQTQALVHRPVMQQAVEQATREGRAGAVGMADHCAEGWNAQMFRLADRDGTMPHQP